MIRAAVSADANVIASLHRAAFPGFFLSSLGKGFLKIYYSSLIGYKDSTVIIYEDNGIACGFATGSNKASEFFRYLLRHKLLQFMPYAVAAFLRRPWIGLKLLSALLYPNRQKRKAGYNYLMSIAVDPQNGQKGAGSALLNDFVGKSRNLGVRGVILETDHAKNDTVKQFYGKNGFTLSRTYKKGRNRVMAEYLMEF
jgi:ribosomal protein S18 acetylase RimI-like enzyme